MRKVCSRPRCWVPFPRQWTRASCLAPSCAHACSAESTAHDHRPFLSHLGHGPGKSASGVRACRRRGRRAAARSGAAAAGHPARAAPNRAAPSAGPRLLLLLPMAEGKGSIQIHTRGRGRAWERWLRCRSMWRMSRRSICTRWSVPAWAAYSWDTVHDSRADATLAGSWVVCVHTRFMGGCGCWARWPAMCWESTQDRASSNG
mmetsp:Transcript_19211/g.46352  ORF Transcript_19211/g.46352 Transcript_19211/m.46352 type:complete len:203 (-) Transcript_19211:150-758(-)